MNEILTIQQYAEMRGITAQAVCARLRRGRPLRGIAQAVKHGRIWVLHTNGDPITVKERD